MPKIISVGFPKGFPPCIIEPAMSVDIIVKKNKIKWVLEISGNFIILFLSIYILKRISSFKLLNY